MDRSVLLIVAGVVVYGVGTLNIAVWYANTNTGIEPYPWLPDYPVVGGLSLVAGVACWTIGLSRSVKD